MPALSLDSSHRTGSYTWLGRLNGQTQAVAPLLNGDDLSDNPPRGLLADAAGTVDVVMANDETDTTVTVALIAGDNPLSIKTMVETNGVTVMGGW